MLRLLAASLLIASSAALALADDDLLTVAEKTHFKATATHADVIALCKKLEAASKGIVTLTDLGTSTEGRTIPLMIVADPPVKTPEEAKKSGKLVALIIGNIHAGEVDGKEAIPMLVREIIADPSHPLRKELILLLAPIYNADGNEKFAKTNRPGQIGPEEGMGVRHNGQGLDLNRDFVKLEAPETRGLVQIINAWDPHLFMDLHTTNGSHHRYEITYQGPKNPAGDPKVLAYVRDVLMPEAGKALEKKTGYKSFFYGSSTATSSSGRPMAQRRGSARRTSASATGCRFCPKPTRMLTSKRVCSARWNSRVRSWNTRSRTKPRSSRSSTTRSSPSRTTSRSAPKPRSRRNP